MKKFNSKSTGKVITTLWECEIIKNEEGKLGIFTAGAINGILVIRCNEYPDGFIPVEEIMRYSGITGM